MASLGAVCHTFNLIGNNLINAYKLTFEFALGKKIPREKRPKNAPDVTPPVV